MGTFQTEFRGIEAAEKEQLHKELWVLYSERVNELVRGGADRLDAERKALEPTRVAFAKEHPELPAANWAIRVVQP
jgi:hypothetical protein